MKSHPFTASVLSLGVLIMAAEGAAAQGSAPEGAAVRMQIRPVASGDIVIALYEDEAGWVEDRAVRTLRIAAADGRAVAEFTGLAPGDYAVRFFHDRNGDGELNTNLLGIPSEGYGFSNGARPQFRAARWEEAVFEASAGEVYVETIRPMGG